VFSKTKHGADRLVEQLERDGIDSVAIHGNKSQPQRTKALKRFKDGQVRLLVATDIAARGLDIEALPHVVNFDLPNVPEDYVHRIGRTGRAGATGDAVTLVSGEDRTLLKAVERLIQKEIKLVPVEGFDPTPAYYTAQPEKQQPRGQRQQRGGQRQAEPRREQRQPAARRSEPRAADPRRQPHGNTDAHRQAPRAADDRNGQRRGNRPQPSPQAAPRRSPGSAGRRNNGGDGWSVQALWSDEQKAIYEQQRAHHLAQQRAEREQAGKKETPALFSSRRESA
jgi:ATP-dependent RNA helicase RhlE